MAERAGFEPASGYEPEHAFQACDLSRSSTSLWKRLRRLRDKRLAERTGFEPAWRFRPAAFQAVPIGLSGTPPLVAGAGLEPATSGLWARQATNCSTPQRALT